MALLVPDVGEVALLSDMLGNGNNMTLKLYKTDVTPAEGDTAGSYTEADFTGYSAATLTRSVSGSTWATPSTASGTTSSEYNSGTPQTWTNTGASQTVYGYFVIDAIAGTLLWAEKFATARTLATNDTLDVTPAIELA